MLNQTSTQLSSASVKQTIVKFKEDISRARGYEDPAQYIALVNKILQKIQLDLGVSTSLSIANLAFLPLKENHEGNYTIDENKTLNNEDKFFLESSLSQIISRNYTSINQGIITSPKGNKNALGNMILLSRIDDKPVANLEIAGVTGSVRSDEVSDFAYQQSLFALDRFKEVSRENCAAPNFEKLTPEELLILRNAVVGCYNQFVDNSQESDNPNSLRRISLFKMQETVELAQKAVNEFSFSTLSAVVKQNQDNLDDVPSISGLAGNSSTISEIDYVEFKNYVVEKFSRNFLQSTKEMQIFINELNSKGLDASIFDGNESVTSKLGQGRVFIFDNMLSIIQTELNKKINFTGNTSSGIIYSSNLVDFCSAAINQSSIKTDVCKIGNETIEVGENKTSFVEIYSGTSQDPAINNTNQTSGFDSQSSGDGFILQIGNKVARNILFEVPPAFINAFLQISLSYDRDFKTLSPDAQNLIFSCIEQSVRMASLISLSEDGQKALIGLGVSQFANGLIKIAKTTKTGKSLNKSLIESSYIKQFKANYDAMPSALREGLKGFAFVALYQSIIDGISTSKDGEDYQSRVLRDFAAIAITAFSTGLMRGFLQIAIDQLKNKSSSTDVNTNQEDRFSVLEEIPQEEDQTRIVVAVDSDHRDDFDVNPIEQNTSLRDSQEENQKTDVSLDTNESKISRRSRSSAVSPEPKALSASVGSSNGSPDSKASAVSPESKASAASPESKFSAVSPESKDLDDLSVFRGSARSQRLKLSEALQNRSITIQVESLDQGEKPESDKPESDKPESDKVKSDKPESDKPESDKQFNKDKTLQEENTSRLASSASDASSIQWQVLSDNKKSDNKLEKHLKIMKQQAYALHQGQVTEQQDQATEQQGQAEEKKDKEFVVIDEATIDDSSMQDDASCFVREDDGNIKWKKAVRPESVERLDGADKAKEGQSI